MSSDNGKAGEIDWYDVWTVAEYIEEKYKASVEINLSSATKVARPTMLLCASIVGNVASGIGGSAGSHVIPLEPGAMRNVPKMAYELLLALQEEFDGQVEAVVVLPPRF